MSATRREQFEGVYREHQPAVRAYLLRRANRELAHDALSETFLAAWRRFEELPADPLPWLLGTARRSLANQRRSAQRLGGLRERLAQSELVADADPTEQLADAELVRAAMAELSEGDREVLMLMAWEGLDSARAAKVMGCSRAAFAVRLHRARKRLDRALFALEFPLPAGNPDPMEAR